MGRDLCGVVLPRSMLRTAFAESINWFSLNDPRWFCRLEPV